MTESTDEQTEQTEQTEWHRLFGVEQDLALTPTGVGVETEFVVTTEPPKVDVLLLQQTGDQWTEAQKARLPDGIRESTVTYNLVEFKYTESLTLDIFWQALGYEHFFRTSRRLPQAKVRLFILSAKTPHAARLTELGFVKTDLPGVWRGENIYVRHVTLLLLNQLRDLPHNAFVKTFASRQVEKRKAFALLNNFTGLSTRLVTFLQGLQAIWSLTEGGTMNEILTPERVMEIGEVWKKTLLQSMTPKELDMYLPEYKQTLLAQGLGQGLEQGLEQGIALAKRETVQAMAVRKFDLAVIADLTGLTLAQVNAILADETTAA